MKPISTYISVLALAISCGFTLTAQAQISTPGQSDSDYSLSPAATKAKPKPKPAKPKPISGEPSPAPSEPVSNAPVQGNVTLDTCFSPGNCDQKLIALINSAQSTLEIAIYSLTHTGISQAIVAAKTRGVQVRLVVDKSQSKGKSSQVASLESAGVSLKIGNFKGIMHDKFTIVDQTQMETGSFNYSENATANNAENQLYLNDAEVIARYESNFNTMFSAGLESSAVSSGSGNSSEDQP